MFSFFQGDSAKSTTLFYSIFFRYTTNAKKLSERLSSGRDYISRREIFDISHICNKSEKLAQAA
jgi:hypothetical protein